MIDHDDADSFWLVSMMTSGPVGFICFVIFLVLSFYACQNEIECSQKTCPNEMTAKLSDNACICFMEAK